MKNTILEKSERTPLLFDNYQIPIALHTVGSDVSIINGTIDSINSFFDNLTVCDVSLPANNIRFCSARSDIFNQPVSEPFLLPPQFSTFNACEDDLALKMAPRMLVDKFPTSNYLNIYLVDAICAPCETYGCAVGGYATLPSSEGTVLDGIVLEIDTWCNPSCENLKIIVHEIGHYLGLYHTFKGGCANDDCSMDGDMVCDTPPQHLTLFSANDPCLQNIAVNTCTTDTDGNSTITTDLPDPADNIMNYTPLECQSVLTEGQMSRMANTLSSVRSDLVTSSGCNLPCSDNIDISIDIPQYLLIDSTYTFINNSSGFSTSQWSILGIAPVATMDFQYSFSNTGNYEVTLAMGNDDEACATDTTFSVTVHCQPPIDITVDNSLLQNQELLTASIVDPDPLATYMWYLGDSIIGQGPSLSTSIEGYGSYGVYATDCSESCRETSNIAHILVEGCPSEREGELWIFGRDGVALSWSDGSPPIELENFHDPLEPVNSFRSDEASSIQLDSDGNILFFTDGFNVYGRDHSPIENGRISGNPSSSQILSLRKPGSSSIYYIFYPEFRGHTLAQDSLRTIHYAILDMNADNGNGEILEKDIDLLHFGTEQITATRHCNGSDWWIVTHPAESAEFQSFLLSDSGLSTIPIVSSIGPFQPYWWGKFGFIKFSHDGRLLAHTSQKFANPQTDSYAGYTQVYNFDNSNGRITSLIFQDTSILAPFGIEFSSSNRFLYMSSLHPDDDSTLYQYDLGVLEQDSILASRFLFTDIFPTFKGGSTLQLAKDNKIYQSYYNNSFNPLPGAIHVIHNPNKKGIDANLEIDGLTLQNGFPSYGLPSFPGGVFRYEHPKISGPATINLCIDSIASYTATGRCTQEEYIWGLTGSSELILHDFDSVSVYFSDHSVDTLTLTRVTACGIYTDSLPIYASDCNFECNMAFDWIAVDTLICQGEQPSLRFSTNANKISVNNVESSILSSVIATGPLYQDTCLAIRLLQNFACDSTFNICITVSQPLMYPDLEDSYSICSGQPFYFPIETDADIIELYDPESDTVFFPTDDLIVTDSIYQSTAFTLRLARFDGNCDSYFPILISLDTTIYYGSLDTIMCSGSSLVIDNLLITQDGSYQLQTLTSYGCDSLLDINVDYYAPQTPDTTYSAVCNFDDVDTMYTQILDQNNCVYYDVHITTFAAAQIGYYSLYVCNSNLPSHDTIISSSTAGCDSITVVEQLFSLDSSRFLTYIDTLICPLDTLSFLDSSIYTVGQYEFNLLTSQSCDSILILSLDYYDQIQGDTSWTDVCYGTPLDTVTSERLSDDGCLIYDVEITVSQPSLITNVIANTCSKAAIDLKDTSFYLSSSNCDSIVYTSYAYDWDSVRYTESMQQEVCYGESYQIMDTTFYATGQHSISLTSLDGCDSLIILDLLVRPEVPSDTSYIIECDASLASAVTIDTFDSFGCSYKYTIVREYIPLNHTIISNYTCTIPDNTIDTTTITSAQGCDSIILIQNTYTPVNLPQIDGNTVYSVGDQFDLTLSDTYVDYEYNWFVYDSFICTNCQALSTNATSGLLSLQVVSPFGCIDTITQNITLLQSQTIHFSNIFSPNNDGINDLWEIDFKNNSINSTHIYDRWGNLITKWQNVNTVQWDGTSNGKLMQPGVYVYIVTVEDGSRIIGDVTIIR